MSEETREYTIRDKPAERGITINNVLLGLLLVGGTLFGNIITTDITEIKASTKSVEFSIGLIQIENSATLKDIEHIKKAISEHKKDCKITHTEIENRLRELEIFMQTHRVKNIN